MDTPCWRRRWCAGGWSGCGRQRLGRCIGRTWYGVEVTLIDRIRALEALCGLLSEEMAEGAGELYRVLTEAAGEEGGWDDG